MFSWTHNGTTINTHVQLAVNGNTSRLTINNVRYSDGGSYVCTVRSGSLSVTSNTATITVYGKLNYSYVYCIIASPLYVMHCLHIKVDDGVWLAAYNYSGLLNGKMHE